MRVFWRPQLILLAVTALAFTAGCGISRSPAADTGTPTLEATTPSPAPIDAPVITGPRLVAFRMFDDRSGWGISESAILRTADGARTWHDVSPTNVDSFGYVATTEFIDPLRGWVLVPNPDDILSGILYSTADGGQTWNQAPVPFGGGGLRFFDGRNGWMMSSLGAGAGSMAIAVYQTDDAGLTWKQRYVNDPNQQGAGDSLPLGGLKNGLTPIDALRAWIGGVTYEPGRIYLYETFDGGHTWKPGNVEAPEEYAEAELQTPGPTFVDPEVGFLPVHISHQYGVMLAVYATHNSGATWILTPQYIPQGGTTDFVSREVGFVWNGHNFYATADGANSWITIVPDIDFSDSFAGMDFVSAQVGFLLSDQGDLGTRVYVTKDAGTTWNVASP